MRFPHNGYITDKYGNVLLNETVNIYLAGTTTPATVYEDSTTVTSVNTVTSDEYGRFEFWVDNTDYDVTQLFKVEIVGNGSTITYDNIPIYNNIMPIDTDNTLSADSDSVVPSQKAVKYYIDNNSYINANLYGDLNTTVTTLGSTECNLIITDNQTLTANVSFPSTMSVTIIKGGYITKASTYTVTFSSQPIIGNYQVFSGFSSGNVTGLTEARPEWWGAVGDGATNDSSSLVLAASSLSAGGKFIVEDGKNYYINSASTITFANQVSITGTGTITIGTTVGQRPAITLAGNKSIVRDITIVGDHSSFTNASYLSELRRSIKVTGDDVLIDNVKFTGGIFPIELSQVDRPTVINCKFTNTDINVDEVGTYPNQNYCQAIYATGDVTDALIEGNYAYGYGEFVSSGLRCTGWRISNNIAELQGDNGIYVNGYNFSINNNSIKNVTQAAIKGYLSNSTVNNNTISTTGSYRLSNAIYIAALATATGQAADSDGNTSYNINVSNNNCVGDFTSNVILISDHPSTGEGFRNCSIVNNSIRAAATTATATSGVAGITISYSVTPLVTYGVKITGNTISQCYQGIKVLSTSPGGHYYATISNNTMNAIIQHSISLNTVIRGLVSNNIANDNIGTVVSPAGVSMIDTTDTTFSLNHLGISEGSGSNQIYAFYRSSGTQARNRYVNNWIYGIANYAYHYHSLVATDLLVNTNNTRIRTLTGNSSFYAAEGPVLLIDAGGGARNYNPTGTFPAGYEVTLINTSDAAEDLTFDSTGIAVAIGQGKSCKFIYIGSAWRQITAVSP